MPVDPSALAPVYRGRFAPSPTGPLHFGSLLAALASWLRARSLGGRWLLRIEDIDPPREVSGASASILTTLAAFGMESDEPVLFQHDRGEAYAVALQQLVDAGLAFPCRCSRTDLLRAGGHHGRCQPHAGSKRQPAWRLLAPPGVVTFDDAVQGLRRQDVAKDVGDFVLRRSDGLWAYQLAVVVDDAAQGVTEVLRGADLLDSTARQIVLQRALALPTPAYAHIPVLLGDDGQKLSKQTFAAPVDACDPVPALRHALALLDVPAAALPAGGNVPALLEAAIPHFRLPGADRGLGVPAAAWRRDDIPG
jgi:glutamyl-Q tRNA(Asp) synthetase